MKNLLILLLLLLINGCTSFSLFGEKRAKSMAPETKPVEVITVARTAPIYQGYENLSMTMGEVTRYLEQILHIVGYYKELDDEEEAAN